MSNPAEISEIMANAKKLIEEKKAQLGIKIGNVFITFRALFYLRMGCIETSI